MSLWVVVGGQYGSEGKGKVSGHIIRNEGIDISVRCGGPNSGHSFILDNGECVLLRQLSVGVIRKQTRLLIPAGGVINLKILFDEITRYGLDETRVGVDRNALILEGHDIEGEKSLDLNKKISSTLSGTGHALSRRILRTDAKLAKDIYEDWFRLLLTDVAGECLSALDNKKNVLIEGTQGFGLSLYHSPYYPCATSRDTSAAGMLSEVGLSPRLVDQIVLVFRTFPIRVSGSQAGPLWCEIPWSTVERESGSPSPIQEYTSVTRKVRRVGRFDWDIAKSAINLNRPTKVALMGIDYLNYADTGKCYISLSEKSRHFIGELNQFGKVSYIGTGPKFSHFSEI